MEYVASLKARFGNELFGDPMLEMKNLLQRKKAPFRQEGSFSDYQRGFDNLVHRVSLIEKVSERATIS